MRLKKCWLNLVNRRQSDREGVKNYGFFDKIVFLTDPYLSLLSTVQRCPWVFKSGWASSNVVGIICPPGCNRVNWTPKFQVGFSPPCPPTKGQKKSKWFFQVNVSSKKRTNEFYFTTMRPHVDLFSFVFWRKLMTLKRRFEIKWPLAASLQCAKHLRTGELEKVNFRY